MTQTPDKSRWSELDEAVEIAPGELHTVKRGRHQLVVGRTQAGALFALDNRCPHEGYPLAQGSLYGSELTCCWHNWKFDVTCGACTLGGEAVRAYPIREARGRIEVDLSDPDAADLVPQLYASLDAGLFRYDNGRALRDAARLLEAGVASEHIAAHVAAYDGRRAEYGSTHALPVAADVARFFVRYPGADALYALAPAIDMCGDANRRLPERESARAVALDPAQAGDELRRAVEAEDAVHAEGILLGAFAAGLDRATIEAWLYAALSDHFLDFGHALIYLVKSQELLDRAGDEFARDVHRGQLHGIVLGTREDTLPYMRSFSERLGEREHELDALYARATRDAVVDPTQLRDTVLDGSPAEAFDILWEALGRGASPGSLARALVGAGAHRLLRFDDRLDRDPLIAESWLWATHRFTFASAVRNAVERFRSPDALRFLVQAVAFINTGRRMDLPAERRAVIEPVEATAAEVVAAIGERDPRAAQARALGFLRAHEDISELRTAIEDLCLRDPLVRPIVVAHAIKTAVAGFEEYAALQGHPDREVALLAAVRFLASPVVERRVHQAATTSLRWVVDGKMQEKLTQ